MKNRNTDYFLDLLQRTRVVIFQIFYDKLLLTFSKNGHECTLQVNNFSSLKVKNKQKPTNSEVLSILYKLQMFYEVSSAKVTPKNTLIISFQGNVKQTENNIMSLEIDNSWSFSNQGL